MEKCLEKQFNLTIKCKGKNKNILGKCDEICIKVTSKMYRKFLGYQKC